MDNGEDGVDGHLVPKSANGQEKDHVTDQNHPMEETTVLV